MVNRKKLATILIASVSIVCVLLVVILSNVFLRSYPHPGEGYVDPVSGIHIAHSGEITGAPLTSRVSTMKVTSTRSQAT